jgi:hypothetical protein
MRSLTSRFVLIAAVALLATCLWTSSSQAQVVYSTSYYPPATYPLYYSPPYTSYYYPPTYYPSTYTTYYSAPAYYPTPVYTYPTYYSAPAYYTPYYYGWRVGPLGRVRYYP